MESVNRVYRVDGVNDDSRRLESGNLSKPATRQLKAYSARFTYLAKS